MTKTALITIAVCAVAGVLTSQFPNWLASVTAFSAAGIAFLLGVGTLICLSYALFNALAVCVFKKPIHFMQEQEITTRSFPFNMKHK